MHLDAFNALDAAEARSVVSVWAGIPRWVDAVVAGRPYPDLAALEATIDADAWTPTDLEAALAHHPRIGERPAGSGAEAAASRSEQSSMTDAAADIAERIAAGNRAYEERFGRVFLIRAAGRSPEEMLAALERRLASDPDDEVREALVQLAEIARLRLRGAMTEESAA